ncbi:MAG: tRNA lysidine(34) synthetase TilS [Sphingomonadales bacterium]|nr:tRNA lysidine(34) synthetase TilS [Sphingomonadales bacterium]
MPTSGPSFEALSSVEFDQLMKPFDVSSSIAVAVSGGADSLALVRLLAEWAGPRNISITALTVDHGLRVEAADEALQVGRWLSGVGINHNILTWKDAAKRSSRVQARARDARYGLMADWCRAHGAEQLFVAHHQGDQAETFIMRLKRSSTLFGLAAMALVRNVHGIQVCRPLLGVAKVRLEAALKERGQAWVEDPSNTNLAFERVRTRALIESLSAEGVTAVRLANAADAAGRLTAILDRSVIAFEETAMTPRACGGFDVEIAAFMALPKVLRERVLGRALRRVSGRDYAPSPAKLERLSNWMAGEGLGSAGARTLSGCRVLGEGDVYSIALEAPRTHVKKAKKVSFFGLSPLPQAPKRLTSHPYNGAQTQTKC